MVAPLDGLQLNVTLLLDVVGPGLLSEPGLGLVGVVGMLAVAHVSDFGVLVRLVDVLKNLTVMV